MNSKLKMTILLGSLMAIGPFSIDTYLPAFTGIADTFHVSVSRVGFTLSTYLFGVCCGQVIHGSLLDRFGHRRPVLAGFALYIAASLGCSLAPNIEVLALMRCLQAMGGCVGMVASRSLARHFFPKEVASIFSSLMLVMGVAPIIAPSLGGFISVALGWRAIFGLLSFIGAVLFLAAWRMIPADRPKGADRASLNPLKVFKEYKTILATTHFAVWTVVTISSYACMFAYISGAPTVYMKIFGLTPTQFSYAFGLNAIGLVAASQINRFLVSRFQETKICRLAALLLVCVAAGLYLGGWMGMAHLVSAGLIWCTLFLRGYIEPNASAQALMPFLRNSGKASALLGTLQMGLGACVSAVMSASGDTSLRPMGLVMLVFSLLALTFATLGRRRAVRAAA